MKTKNYTNFFVNRSDTVLILSAFLHRACLPGINFYKPYKQQQYWPFLPQKQGVIGDAKDSCNIEPFCYKSKGKLGTSTFETLLPNNQHEQDE